MYAKYIWNNTATQAQMLDDICNLLTNMAIAGLSASCDKVNSVMMAQSATNNWEMYDAAASASAKVLRSLNEDGTTYKYAHISFASSILTLTTYESWNAATHVGTNQAFVSTAVLSTHKVHTAFDATGGTIYLYATSNTLLITNKLHFAAVSEFLRSSPTLNTTYPCTVVYGGDCSSSTSINGTGIAQALATIHSAGCCRVKYANAAGDLKFGSTPAATYTQFAVLGPANSASYGFASSGETLPINDPDLGVNTYTLFPLIVYAGLSSTQPSANDAHTLGIVVGPLVMSSAVAANSLDEITIEATTYILFPTSLSFNVFLLLPKG